MPAWEPILEPEYTSVWGDFTRQFRFRPSTNPRDWPSIKEPTPSRTYRLKELSSIDAKLANAWALQVLKACQPEGKRIVALDWNHDCWRMDVHLADAPEGWDRRQGVVPDGDYSIFLSRELESGMFGHPWEWTFCIFGAALLREVERNPPMFIEGILRENETSPRA